MATLSYEKIFSRVRNKSYDPKELSLSDDDLMEINIERLHSGLGNIRVRKMFSTLKYNDETEELIWVLKNSATGTNQDDEEEEDFVVEILALSIVIEWMKPQIESLVNIGKAIGGKEEKTLNDKYKPAIDRLNSLEIQLSKMIRDHGYLYNDYLQG